MRRKSKEKPVPLLARHYLQASAKRRFGPIIVADAEDRMKKILAAAGMPIDVLEKSTRGCYRDVANLTIWRGHQIGSEVWFAAKILEQIADTRRAMDDSNHDQFLLDEALHLGALLQNANTIIGYGPAIDVGIKVYNANSKGRETAKTNRKKKADGQRRKLVAEAEKIRRKDPQLNDSACAWRIIQNLGLNKTQHRSIRAAIAGGQQKKVGNVN
jgi:hypothetical protein